jgi:hypothetical protein
LLNLGLDQAAVTDYVRQAIGGGTGNGVSTGS